MSKLTKLLWNLNTNFVTDGGGREIFLMNDIFLPFSKADNNNLRIFFDFVEQFDPLRFEIYIQPRIFVIFKSAVCQEWSELILYVIIWGFFGQVNDIELTISLFER